MWCVFWLLVHLLALQPLTGEEANFKQVSIPSSSLASTSGLLPSFVNGSVSVITGDYVDSAVDLACDGPEPLLLERSYASSDFSSSHLCTGWHLNPLNKVHLKFYKKYIPENQLNTDSEDYKNGFDYYATYYDAVVEQPSGSMLLYTGDKEQGAKEGGFLLVNTRGMTNCGTGFISAQTNVKNQHIQYHTEGMKVTTPEHDKKYYTNILDSQDYFLTRWKKSNGATLEIDYHKVNSIIIHPTKISGNIHSTEYAWMAFDQPSSYSKFRKNPVITVTSSAGQSVKYHFKTRGGDYPDNDYLIFVEKSHQPWERFSYVKDSQKKYRLSKKEKPQGRFIENEYYTYGVNKLGFCNVDVDNDFRLDRVKTQRDPYGTTHSFLYHKKNKGGVTEVFDALHHKISYEYDKHHHITEINRWQGSYGSSFQLYAKEQFLWGADDNENNLMGKLLFNAEGHVHSGRLFEYDTAGNILSERFYGQLTGMQPSPEMHQEQLHGEFYEKKYTYSDDSWHLLLKETEEDGRQIHYRYKPNTNIMTARYLAKEDQVQLREFYTYNDDAILTEIALDDGTSFDPASLEGATERRITRMTPRTSPPFGLPEKTEEWVCHVPTGKEELMHRIISTHSLEGHLLKQDHYDNEGEYHYSLEWEYDPHGNVTKEINAIGEFTLRQYDKNDNLTYIKGDANDPNALYINYHYDLCNRLIKEEKITELGAFVTSYTYNKAGHLESSIDPYGNETQYEHDEFGRVILKRLPKVLDEDGKVITPEFNYSYDIADHPTEVIDPNGHATLTSYNAYGSPLSITKADGTLERKVYAKDGRLLETISTNGLITGYEYDVQQRVVKEKVMTSKRQPLQSTTMKYSGFHLESSTNPEKLTTSYQYDKRGRLACKMEGEKKTTWSYDSLNRVASVSQWVNAKEAQVTTYQYDLLNRIVEECIQDLQGTVASRIKYRYDSKGDLVQTTSYSQPGTSIQRIEYNALHQPTKVVDPLGNTTVIEYNYFFETPVGRVLQTKTTDPLGHQTWVTYDTHLREACVEQKNAFGITTAKREIFYDAAGNKAKEVHFVIAEGETASKQIHKWEYNSVNQLIHQIEAAKTGNQKETYFDYNKVGQRSSITKPDGTVIHYSYDEFGRLALQKSSDVSYSYSYDRMHRLVEVEDLKNKTNTSREYDEYGNLTKERLANGLKLYYTHDLLGRIKTVTLPDESSIQYSYDAIYLREIKRNQLTHSYLSYDCAGTLIKSQCMDGTIVNYQYDLLKRPKGIKCKQYTQSHFEYDGVGNLLSTEISDPVGHLEKQFKYDELNHLKTEKGIQDHSYTTDSLHNRLAMDDKNYSVNSLNQLTKQPGIKYRYDPNGNLVEKIESGSETSYQYDDLDRLVAVKDQNASQYIYDGLNRRISKIQGDKTIHFIYQDQNEIGSVEKKEIVELRILGIGKGAEIGAAVAYEIDHETYIPIHDHIGNVAALLNQQGKPIEAYRYTAFGEEEIYDENGSQKATSINPWRFSSKRFDAESGFLYFGRRYYEPSIGRWITPDPLGFADGPNLYAYVQHNPMTHIDLYGLKGVTWETIGRALKDFSQKMFDGIGSGVKRASGWCKHVLRDHYIPLEGIHRALTGSKGDYSRIITVGTWELENRQMVYFDGMNTTAAKTTKDGEELSETLGGIKITCIHNATKGFVLDIVECVLQAVRLQTEANIVAKRAMKQIYKANPNVQVFAVAFSQGALVCNKTVSHLTKAQTRRVDLFYVAPGGYAPPGICRRVTHVRAEALRDFIPRLDCFGALLASNTIVTVKSHPEADGFDHAVNSKSYAPLMKEKFKAFCTSNVII